MKLPLWLLDLNSETTEGHPEIHLWSLNKKGERTLLRDSTFLPHFHLTLDGTHSPNEVATAARAEIPQLIQDIQPETRRLFGKTIDTLKVTLNNPEDTTKTASTLAKLPGIKQTFEDDLRYTYLYTIDRQITPSNWHEVNANPIPTPKEAQVDQTLEATQSPKTIEDPRPPHLTILAFTLTCYSPKGAPNPKRSPIATITCTTPKETKQFTAHDLNDKTTLQNFLQYIHTINPDIIATYGGNTFEYPYLLERAKTLGLSLNLSRTQTQPHRSTYGHTSITGRANLDLADYAEEIPEVKIKTLQNIAQFLGIPQAKEEPIEEIDYPNYWDDAEKRKQLLIDAQHRTNLILAIAQEILPFAQELSRLSGLPLDQVGTAAVGFRTESLLIREAHKQGELIPRRQGRPYIPYQGAIVLTPKPGLHKNVTVYDFSSMYPNLMINHNLSPDTYIDPKEKTPNDEANITPEVGHRFRKTPPGLYTKVLTQLIQARNQVRTELKQHPPGTTEHRLLEARQRAIKVMTNAAYGYAGWTGARWYVHPVAEAAAAWGRQTITQAIKLAKDLDLDVIYGDTDSIFIKAPPTRTEEFQKRVETKLGLEIRPSETYKRIFFTEAKKRYAGLLTDDTINIVGLEVARGDWSNVAKKTQEEALEILLKEESPQKAAKHVQQRIKNLREGKTPYKDLIIWKTITKDPKSYAVKAPHVEAAKHLAKEGWELSTGQKVGFVITKGKGRLYERAIPYAFASIKDTDLLYYEEQQIIPSALRILGNFNIGKTDLTPTANNQQKQERPKG